MIRSDVPAELTKVAVQSRQLYDLQEYQPDNLREYFNEGALLFPVETIVQKTQLKDFKFFLEQKNFLKVVDTLEKYQAGLLNKESPQAREFVLFKRELYQIYEISNRSVHEHELYSFNIERENLKWLYQANVSFINEVQTFNIVERVTDHSTLKGAVFKRKLLNPPRLKGLGALAASAGIYSYLPYLTVYLGPTVPLLTAVLSGVYGMI